MLNSTHKVMTSRTLCPFPNEAGKEKTWHLFRADGACFHAHGHGFLREHRRVWEAGEEATGRTGSAAGTARRREARRTRGEPRRSPTGPVTAGFYLR